MKQKAHGFTVVELLIVIVVIGILAAITIVSYTGIRDRAQAVQIVSSYRAIDKAFQLAAIQNGWSTWPDDDVIVPNDPDLENPYITTLSSLPAFSGSLPESVVPKGVGLRYDADAHEGSHIDCGTDTNGVSIYTQGDVSLEVAKQVDQMIDGHDDLLCGKVAYYPTKSEFKIFLSFTFDM